MFWEYLTKVQDCNKFDVDRPRNKEMAGICKFWREKIKERRNVGKIMSPNGTEREINFKDSIERE